MKDLLMKKMNILELDVYAAYSSAIADGEIDFVKAYCSGIDEKIELLWELQATDQFSELPALEIRNDGTGNVFDVWVLRVSEDGGISTVRQDDEKTQNWYKFSDISDIKGQILFIGDIEDAKKTM
jgi:hypothetical protein